jgi:hypothetical protein
MSVDPTIGASIPEASDPLPLLFVPAGPSALSALSPGAAMRSLHLAKILELHEDARPVWRIVEATNVPDAEVRRMLRAYQNALAANYRRLKPDYKSRTAVAEAYVLAFCNEGFGPDWVAERVGIPLKLAEKIMARIERRRRSGGAAALKLSDATLTGQSGPLW